MNDPLEKCQLCPRKCEVNRHIKKGYCLCGDRLIMSRIAKHYWEEPCFCDSKRGVGAFFFAGCPMHCVFCQNYAISGKIKGKEISIQTLADCMIKMRDDGATAIDLVTPTHYTYHIIKALDLVKNKLDIPIVYNCGGYENIETLKMLDGYVDIYLPDFKFLSSETAKKYAAAADYPQVCLEALKYMVKQKGKLVHGGKRLVSGVIVRHLCLPGHRHESIELMNLLGQTFSPDEIMISLMAQYTPYVHTKYKNLNRKITKFEYYSVVEAARKYNFDGYIQEISSAKEEYVPDFEDLGIIK